MAIVYRLFLNKSAIPLRNETEKACCEATHSRRILMPKMNAIEIDTLLRTGTIDIPLATLSQGKPLTFCYAKGTLIVIPKSTMVSSTPVTSSAFRKIYDRYISAPTSQRMQAGYYNAPKWPTAPDLNFSPWVMRLIHYFETGN